MMGLAPRPGTLPLEIAPDPREFRRASAWLRATAASLGVPAEPTDRLELCLNEVLANLLEHGGVAVAAHPIALQLDVLQQPGGGEVQLVVSDRGEPFDSGQARLKPLAASLEQATPGGLGLRLLKAFSDAMEYRVHEGRNDLTIAMHWSSRS
jgi:anti-sigma regulatory factor (Ser/Thr protein kinase)